MEGHFCWGQPYITPRVRIVGLALSCLPSWDLVRSEFQHSLWTSKLLGSLSWSWGRGRRDLNELRKIWIPQMLNSHSLHITPGWHHLVGEHFHSLSWAGYATNSCAIKASKVIKLIVIIWNRCDWKLFSFISILNTFLELPVVFLIGRKTSIRGKEKWGDWVSELNWVREWGWIHLS